MREINPHDVRILEAFVAFEPIRLRVPLKFGSETTTDITCARARVVVTREDGNNVQGWGETPLSATWVWPSDRLSIEYRVNRLVDFCKRLAAAWNGCALAGHALEIGHIFLEEYLPALLDAENEGYPESDQMPYLAALLCDSLFDLAVHDAYGTANSVFTFDAYGPPYLDRDLTAFYPERLASRFRGKFPADYLTGAAEAPQRLATWHLVGGKDPLEPSDLNGSEPQDGYPLLLADWIRRDGLYCLKIKLTGTDAAWDYERVVRIGKIAPAEGVRYLSADFNCTVHDPAYVVDWLDHLAAEHPDIYKQILYIEQPFPYDIERYPIDVTAIRQRKDIFMDESAHDWRFVEMGAALGWNGVALKVCKSLTGALLSFCWAREHGLKIMVQDLTNPRLAMIPHALLAARAATIMGVETNAPQFYPQASQNEERIHPGLFRRRQGQVDLSSLGATGFGYRIDEIQAAANTDTHRTIVS